MSEHTLEDVRAAIRLMRQRLGSGQGRADQAMCRLSLSMSAFLLARVDDSGRFVRTTRERYENIIDCWRAKVAELEREMERWRHGAPIEGDYVCPNEYEAMEAKAALKELREQHTSLHAAAQEFCQALDTDSFVLLNDEGRKAITKLALSCDCTHVPWFSSVLGRS